jgi:hypothetical protein
VVFIGHFYLLHAIAGERAGDIFPPFSAGLCAISVALAWLIKRESVTEIYAIPLRLAGLFLMVIPMVGILVIFDPLLGAVTFGIASITYLGDALLRRVLNLAYVGLCAVVVTVWAILLTFDISEPQAFIIPLGFVLLGVGWYERVRMGGRLYRLLSILGLLVLLGSAFIQSVFQDAHVYAVLLLIESLVFIGWGIGTHSRCFVQLGGLALAANTIVQLGPGFIDLPRWIQIGITGGILLGGGLAALFKREEILSRRRELTDEWRQWSP